MRPQQSPFGDMAGLLQLLPLLSQAGGGMQDIGALAGLALRQQEQEQQGQYQDQRNQLYQQSIGQRQQAAEEQRRMQLADFALKQQAEQRRAQEAQFGQGLSLSRLGMDTQNAELNALYKQKLMESLGVSMEGKLQQQKLLESMMNPQQGQQQQAPTRQFSPQELLFLQSQPQ